MLPAALAMRGAVKLNRTTHTVNSLALLGVLALTAACATTSGRVPREGNNDVPEYLGSAKRTRNPNETIAPNPTVVWRTDAGRGSIGAVAMGERLTLVTTLDRFVTALDTRDGKLHWRYRGVNPFGTGPIVHGSSVFAATEGNPGALVAINIFTGRRRWQARVGDVTAPLAYHNGTVYVVAQEGILHALRSDNGKRRWVHAGVPSRSGAIVVGNYVALVTVTDSLIVLDAATGISRSRTSLGVGTVAPLAALNDSTVVMSSPGAEVIALGLPSGSIRWRQPTQSGVFGAPVVARDSVFVVTRDCRVWRIPGDGTPATGSEPLGCNTVAAPALVRDGVLVATVEGRLVYYNTAEGRVGWTRDIGEELRHPPMILNGQMIVAPLNGKVVSFR
jgi:eukaryotic-like serine/threonine-protein kinase